MKSIFVQGAVLATVVACGSSSSSSSSQAAATSGSTSTSAATTGPGGGQGQGGQGGAALAPMAPTILEVKKMAGALHITWMNNGKCDSVQLLRKKDGGAYAQAYKLTGAAEDKHDTDAMPPGTYCYKATCTLGGMTSTESNEKCGTP